jgi:hypothetical protein
MPSPVAEYLLREGTGTVAHDTSGNGYDGTLVHLSGPSHLPTWYPNGLYFDGDGGVQLPDAVLAFDNTSITAASLEAWVAMLPGASSSFYGGEIITLDDNNFAVESGIEPSGFKKNLFGCEAWSNTGSFINQGHVYSTLPSDGLFRHVVLTYDAANLNIYYDGVLQGTQAVASPGLALALGTSAGSKALGTDIVNRFNSFPGILGEARIYNVALTGAEVLAAYNASKARYPVQTLANVSTIDYSHFAVNSDAGVFYEPRGVPALGIYRELNVNGVLYVVEIQYDSTGADIGYAMYKSTDGLNWTVQDAANSPPYQFYNNQIIVDYFGTTIYVMFVNPDVSPGTFTGLRVISFDTLTNTWGATTPDVPGTDTGSIKGAPPIWFLHVTAANTFNVLFHQLPTTTTAVIYQTRYSGGSWTTPVSIGTEISPSAITGFFIDKPNNILHVLYSQYIFYPGSSFPSPNPVHHRSIDSTGTLSAYDVVTADIQPIFTTSYRSYPTFGLGSAAGGNLIVPLAMGGNSPFTAQAYPAVAVLSSGTWTFTQLVPSSGDFLGNGDPGAMITSIVDGSGKVFVIWRSINGIPANTGPFFVDGQLMYTSSTDNGITWDSGETVLYDPVTEPPPFTDQSSEATLPTPVLFNGGVGVLCEFLNPSDVVPLNVFFSPIAIPPIVSRRPFLQYRRPFHSGIIKSP